MILDIAIVGAILAGCAAASFAGYKKFQPGIESALQKSQVRDSIKVKAKN